MSESAVAVPKVERELAELLSRHEGREVLRRLDEPNDGGALAPATQAILRARALASLERFIPAHRTLIDARELRDVSATDRIEIQLLTARMLRFASPFVDYALDLALSAAEQATRAGAKELAVQARIEAALLFLRKRCRALAERELARAQDLGVMEGRLHVARADLAIGFDERALAKIEYEAAVAAGETRLGLLGLARLHTILGEFDAAKATLVRLGTTAPGDLSAQRTRQRLFASQGNWRELADSIGAYLAVARDADSARSLMLQRASALYKADDLDAARSAWTQVAGDNDDWAARSASRILAKLEKPEAKRTRLAAFPSVAQLRNHCGPASVELCLRFFGVTADQVQVAREIKHPDGGTPVHKMRKYLEKAGFVTRRVEADLDRLKAILDAGVPVILEEDYSTSRHVAVAVGYDDRLEIVAVQDPMSHEIRETPYEELPKLREFSNHGGLVGVPADRLDLLAKLDAIGAVECAYISKTDEAWEARDQERHEDAERLLDEAIALHEPYELAWVCRFHHARNQFADERSDDNRAKVTAIMDKIVSLWPDDEWPQQLLARLHVLEDRYGDALPAYTRARDRDPDDADNWCGIGDCELEAGNRNAARTAFEEALKRDPSHTRSNENLANVAFDSGDLGLAALLSECALELSPRNAFNHHVNGRIRGRKGDHVGAAAAYATALELRPGSSYFTVERAKNLAKSGAVDSALAELETYAFVEKNLAAAVDLADLAYEYDRFDLCLKACALVRECDPQSTSGDAIEGAARVRRAAEQNDKKELAAATKLLREVLGKVPTYAWVHRELGRALTIAGRHDEAITECAAAAGLAQAPVNGFYVGLAMTKAGRNQGTSYLRRAAESGQLAERELHQAALQIARFEGVGNANDLFTRLRSEFPRDGAIARVQVRLLLEHWWYLRSAEEALGKLGELEPDDPFVLAKSGDDLMDESIESEPRGEALLRQAIAKGPTLRAPKRLLARQLLARGRHAEALELLETMPEDDGTMSDRVKALLGLGREKDAKAVVQAYVKKIPRPHRDHVRRPLDFAIAKAGRKWKQVLPLTERLAADSGELADDGRLGHWEQERFEALLEVGESAEAFSFGIAQCEDADDRGTLAYAALGRDFDLAVRLAKEALDLDPNETTSLHVMARAAEHAGDLATARGIWERMREISKWHIHVENLGRLALAEGDLDAAERYAIEAVATGHVCPIALQLRAECRLLRGDREGALTDAKRARDCEPVATRSDDQHALVLALEGKPAEAAKRYAKYLAKEKKHLTDVDRARYARVREALGA